jgi:hypothetical protein
LNCVKIKGEGWVFVAKKKIQKKEEEMGEGGGGSITRS